MKFEKRQPLDLSPQSPVVEPDTDLEWPDLAPDIAEDVDQDVAQAVAPAAPTPPEPTGGLAAADLTPANIEASPLLKPKLKQVDEARVGRVIY